MKEKFVGINLKTRFKKGDRVKCTNDLFEKEALELIKEVPEKGKIYTIRDCFKQSGREVVLLEELANQKVSVPQSNPEYYFQFEPTFLSSRFKHENSTSKSRSTFKPNLEIPRYTKFRND